MKDAASSQGDAGHLGPIPTEAVLEELHRILASQIFAKSERSRRFLRHAVERLIEGRCDEIKESLLGIEVFDRGESFDPRIDPIVRVQANRLRARLEEYYEHEGRSDPIIIEFPGRGYVPLVRKRVGGINAPRRTTQARWRPQWRLAAAVIVGLALIGTGIWFIAGRGTLRVARLTRITAFRSYTDDAALSPDGTLVAFVSDHDSHGGNLSLWLQQVAGGEPIRLTHDDTDVSDPDFSPDGTQIAFRWEKGGGAIYVIPTLGGGEPKLIIQGGRSPKFSPDGRLLAYWTGPSASGDPLAAGSSSVWVVPVSGGPPRPVGAGFRAAGYPVWFPDARRLLIAGVSGGQKDLTLCCEWWVASLDGGMPVRTGAARVMVSRGLRGPTEGPMPGSFDAHGRILFSATTGDSTDLWMLSFTRDGQVTGDPVRLTSETEPATNPSAARDHRVAFTSLRATRDLWSVALDANAGHTRGQIERVHSSDGSEGTPALSTDGRKLAFARDHSGKWEVWLRDMHTGDERPLTSGPENEDAPIFSLDGSKLAMWQAGLPYNVFLVSSAGGPQTKVGEGCGRTWSWLSDGLNLLCSSLDQPRRVLVLNTSNGKKQTFLVDPRYNLYQSRVSPDGRWISFTAILEDGRSRIFVASLQGVQAVPEGSWSAITDGSFRDSHSAWSPDGNLLYFVSLRDGFRCIWAQRLDPVTKQPSEAPFAVQHFHTSRRSLMIPEAEISVAPGLLVVNAGEFAGDIWLAQMKDR